MSYPKEVMTRSRAGKEEARVLVDRGAFVKYRYVDKETGKEDKKVSVILNGEQGREHFFIIPLKGERSLLIKQKSEGLKKVFNENTGKVVEF